MSGLVTVRYWRAPARMRYVFASSMAAPSAKSFPFASIGDGLARSHASSVEDGVGVGTEMNR
jgi:hypothetical protein